MVVSVDIVGENKWRRCDKTMEGRMAGLPVYNSGSP